MSSQLLVHVQFVLARDSVAGLLQLLDLRLERVQVYLAIVCKLPLPSRASMMQQPGC